MSLKKQFLDKIRDGKSWLERFTIKKCPYQYNLNGFKRIYHVHIRKTAGTSINKMFLGLSEQDSCEIYQRLVSDRQHRIDINGLVYAGWKKSYINSGQYFYAFSHIPFHKLSLPEKTFTVTVFRDPIRRLISHYKMLKQYSERGENHPCMVVEGQWLGNSFTDFIDKMPKEHMLNQIYMFSSSLSADEAFDNVQKINSVLFVDKFNEGVNKINQLTGLTLRPIHSRRTEIDVNISTETLDRLRAELQTEYDLIEKIKKHQR